MSEKKKVGLFKGVALIIVAVLALLVITLGSRMVETNVAGFYQVKQQFLKGDLSTRNTPGTYQQNLGAIQTYEIAGDIFLSKDDADGGDDATNAAERVLFPNGYADIDFVGMYEIALNTNNQEALHIMYNDDKGVKKMVKEQVKEALKNTGTLMSAEEAYSSKRAEFVRLAREQALNGLYKAKVTIDTVEAVGGGVQYIKRYSVAQDNFGNPIITKESLLKKYEIELPQFNIKDMDFDSKLLALIDARKDAQKATQDAITEKARGEAKIAAEKATQEVDKIKQVTIAEKEKAVAVLTAEKEKDVAYQKRLAEEENKKATILKAEAKKQELLIADGLSKREEYALQIQKETAIGVAEHLAKWKGPEIVMTGGGDGKGSGVEDALMITMMQQLSSTMSKK